MKLNLTFTCTLLIKILHHCSYYEIWLYTTAIDVTRSLNRFYKLKILRKLASTWLFFFKQWHYILINCNYSAESVMCIKLPVLYHQRYCIHKNSTKHMYPNNVKLIVHVKKCTIYWFCLLSDIRRVRMSTRFTIHCSLKS